MILMTKEPIDQGSDDQILGRLFACSTELASCATLEIALGRIAETLIDVSRADFGTLQLLDKESRQLDLVLAPGFDRSFKDCFRVVTEDDQSACGRALREQRPIYIPDVTKDEAFAPLRTIAWESGFRSVISFPMTCPDEEPIGVVSVHFRDPNAARSFGSNQDVLRFLSHAASTIRQFQDIATLERSEQEQSIFLRELNHRARNMLTILRASERFVSADADPREVGETLTGRLLAIANTQLLLTEGNMEADLGSMIRQQLALGSAFDSRVACSGPQVMLPVDHAFRLSLVIHELATNAQKYGALSNDHGRLSIEWLLSPAEGLVLSWKEKDGPAVKPPDKDGFGMTLVKNVFSSQPDSTIDLSFEPTGLRCRVKLPLPEEYRGLPQVH